MVGFRGIPNRKHNTSHLESNLEQVLSIQSKNPFSGLITPPAVSSSICKKNLISSCFFANLCLFVSLAHITTMKTVRVNNGRVEEFENGSIRRTFGSNIINAATDGQTVVAVTRAGRVETYEDGSIRRTFGSNAQSAQVSGDTVVVQTANGRTEEYVNGSIRRTY